MAGADRLEFAHHGESKPQDEDLQELLFTNTKLLVTLAETGSVTLTAERLQVDPRAVQRRLKMLNDAAKKLTGSSDRELVAVKRGRSGYSLTHHGLAITESLASIYREVQGVVAGYARKSKFIEVTTTSECLGYFDFLTKSNEMVRSGISLLPAHKRTTDVHAALRRQRDPGSVTPLAFYSVALEERQPERANDTGPLAGPRDSAVPPIRASKSVPFHERVEVHFTSSTRGEDERSLWPLKVDEFKILARPELKERFHLDPRRDDIDLQAILDDRWILLAPRWGAVASFLDLTLPGFWRYGEVRDCTDFGTGIKSLRRDLIPRRTISNEDGQVMIVHGMPEKQAAELGFDLFRIRPAERRRPIRALTGLFMNHTLVRAAEESEQKMWQDVWSVATLRVWPFGNDEIGMRSAE